MAVLGLLALGAAPSMAVTPPPVNGQFDYQIGGAYTPLSSVAIVDRDHHDPPVAGKYNICYVNAFQTQPEEASWWKANHGNLLLHDSSGGLVIDSAWNEILLDTSTPAKREALLSIVGPWIDGCATAGYLGLEPDNLDSYTRSKGYLTADENRAFAAMLINQAHVDGLAIAQKNASELDTSGMGFDYAITEECQRYRECGLFTSQYGQHVIEIEYRNTPFNNACAARGSTISIIRRDVEVVPLGAPGYVYKWC